MRIVALIQGYYGERIAKWIKANCPSNWTVTSISFPKISLREALEEKFPFTPPNFEGELMLSLAEQVELNMILPKLIDLCRVKAVIVSVDNPEWSWGLGFEKQIAEELSEKNVKVVFARPLCSLNDVENKVINEFLRLYGKPKLKIEVVDGLIRNVNVFRGSPCGSTWYVAKMIKGLRVKDALMKAGLILQNYPCLASTKMDKLLGDAPIHVSAKIMVESIRHALNLKNHY